jgi:TM2 domain-containing membrane protein YozV
MSEENKEDLFGDSEEKSESTANKAKTKATQITNEARESFEGAKEKASEMAGEAKEVVQNLTEETKETMNDMKENWDQATTNGENKKVIAGILGILIGGLGIHKFILGYNKEGIIQILLSFLCGIGAVIGLIEGIIYLTKSDQEFYQTYQVGKKGWF